jgi:hypothetical protein
MDTQLSNNQTDDNNSFSPSDIELGDEDAFDNFDVDDNSIDQTTQNSTSNQKLINYSNNLKLKQLNKTRKLLKKQIKKRTINNSGQKIKYFKNNQLKKESQSMTSSNCSSPSSSLSSPSSSSTTTSSSPTTSTTTSSSSHCSSTLNSNRSSSIQSLSNKKQKIDDNKENQNNKNHQNEFNFLNSNNKTKIDSQLESIRDVAEGRCVDDDNNYNNSNNNTTSTTTTTTTETSNNNKNDNLVNLLEMSPTNFKNKNDTKDANNLSSFKNIQFNKNNNNIKTNNDVDNSKLNNNDNNNNDKSVLYSCKHLIIEDVNKEEREINNQIDINEQKSSNNNNNNISTESIKVKSNEETSTTITDELNINKVCSTGRTFLWDFLILYSPNEDLIIDNLIQENNQFQNPTTKQQQQQQQDNSQTNHNKRLLKEAERQLHTLICLPSTDQLIRMKFIESCLENLRSNRASVVSLRLLIRIFSSFQQFANSNISLFNSFFSNENQINNDNNNKQQFLIKNADTTISDLQDQLIQSIVQNKKVNE